jgi:hypothetical protein
MEMRIGGDRFGTERAFHVNGINSFHAYAQATYIFHVYELEQSRAKKSDSFVRHSSFKAVAMEEVTDS